MHDQMGEPLYSVDGDHFVPSEDTRGPWDPSAQHAGPVAALLGRALEQLPAETPARIARLTLEVLRPVPLAPLTVTAGVERAGRKVQLLQASMHSGDVEVARARAVRIRT
ncbi:MAG TPA: acyl-CoA thioesterase domain-containing protein, partial [Dehalococcoidia bacterium]|nr:acyl-CoA thioesterase domain-containing protein [Dehalococcoidia bacterium]